MKSFQIRLLEPGDRAVLERVAPGVFDDPLDAGVTDEFLKDHRHHVIVALEDETVVGFATAVGISSEEWQAPGIGGWPATACAQRNPPSVTFIR
jgi:hypothetical protein